MIAKLKQQWAGLSKKISSVPVVGFLWSNWLLLLVAFAALILLRWDAARELLGVFVHLPLLVALVALLALAVRHLVNRKTTEPYSTSGRLKREWNEIEAWQRVLIFKLELWVWIIAGSIIAHSLLG